MSLSLDTVLQVIDIVNRAVAVYHKIQDAPDQMRKIGRRMERLKLLLVQLEGFLRKQEKRALAKLGPDQAESLLLILKDCADDSKKVDELFHKWDNDIGPFGLQLRFKTLAQAYFALGSSSEKLAELANDMEYHRHDILLYMQFMGCIGINDILVNGVTLQQQKNDLLSPTDVAKTDVKKAGAPKKASPSPSPAPPRQDYAILFVDPHNLSRGVVAEGITKLIRGWTLKTGGDWRINLVHSAGFFVKDRNEVADLIDGLKFSHKSYKLDMSNGKARPNAMALASLFDNKAYDFPFKKEIKAQLEARKSRGLAKDVFKKYDFIIVFTGREYDNMQKLRKALVAKEGKDIAPKGKGRLLHLGHYLTLDGIPREIVDAPKNLDGTDSRDNWNFKVSQLKTAIKAFLKQEMKWGKPANNAKVVS